MKPKTRKLKSKRVDRDMFGTPRNRAKTWGSKTNDPKKDRRDIKKDIQEEFDDRH